MNVSADAREARVLVAVAAEWELLGAVVGHPAQYRCQRRARRLRERAARLIEQALDENGRMVGEDVV